MNFPKQAKVRIVVKKDNDSPGTFPCYADTRIIVTSPSGEEFDLPQVKYVRIHMNEGYDPIVADMGVYVDSLDLECIGNINALSEKPIK